MAHRLIISAGLALAVIGVVAAIASDPFGLRPEVGAAQSSLPSDDFRGDQPQVTVAGPADSAEAQTGTQEQAPVYVYPDGTLASGADTLSPGAARHSRGDDDGYEDEHDDDDREGGSGEYERDDD